MHATAVLLMMPFVHPTIAAVAVATGLIPVLIHLINRRRYVRVPWAAMSFLLSANRRSARRVQLEQWLLLLSRVAVIALFGLAVARPYVPASSLLPLDGSRVHRVIMLDNSLSMNAMLPDGQTRLDRAKQYAQRLLDSFPATDAVSLVTLADPAEAVIAQAAFDHRYVREGLAAVQATQRATDTVGALDRTIEIVDASPFTKENRAVYLITDLPRAVWESAIPGSPTPAVRAAQRLADTLAASETDLTVVCVASGESQNVAVTRFGTESALIGVNEPVRLVAEIANHGPKSVAGVELQIRRDGEIIRREPLPKLEPFGTTTATVTTECSTSGTHLFEARLSASAHDVLDEDNARLLSVEVRETRPVLVVDGRPGPTALAGQAGFLVTALAPGVQGAERTLIQPNIITEPELDGEVLSDYDVITLCNVHRLSAETWRRLKVFVTDGGGLLIFGGDRVAVDHYNRFAYADGTALLPGRINRARTTLPDGDEDLTFSPDDLVHPIVAEFADHPESGLFTTRITQYLPVELDASRAEVVLRYTNGDAALVASTLGKGHVLLCTTTANMDWTNLPAKGDYVSLILNAMAYLLPSHGEHRNLLVGQTIRERLTAVESSLPLRVMAPQRPPTGAMGKMATAEPALVSDGGALALEYGPIERARAVTIAIGSEVRTFVANVDSAESDLTVMEEQAFLEALDRPIRMVSNVNADISSRAATRATELASVGFYLLIVLLLAEVSLAMWFGTQRARPSQRDEAVRRGRATRTFAASFGPQTAKKGETDHAAIHVSGGGS